MTEWVDAYIASLRRADEPINTPKLKIGGSPVFINSLEAPICQDCGKEMDFLAQIPLDTPIQFSKKFKMAYVFMCPGSYDSRGWLECKTYEPFSGANAVILQQDNGLILLPEASPRYPDYSVSLTKTREPQINTADYTADWDLRDQVSLRTKIGGVPLWIQENETPSCPNCMKPMRLVAQIGAELDGSLPTDRTKWKDYNFLDFGDVGFGYVFICQDTCNEGMGAFLWQC